MLYNAIINPYFTYCIEVWGSTYSTYVDIITKVQKRAIRAISNAKKLDHTGPLYKKLRLLNIKEIYIYYIQLFIFKYHQKSSQSFLITTLQKNSLIYDRDTRQQSHLHIPLIRTLPFSRTVRLSGACVYNFFYKLAEIKKKS